MIIFLNKKKTIPLDEILLIKQEKHKQKKRKTVIFNIKGKKIIVKNNINIIIKRIEKQNGFLKENKELFYAR